MAVPLDARCQSDSTTRFWRVPPARATNPRTGGRLTPRPAGTNPRTGQAAVIFLTSTSAVTCPGYFLTLTVSTGSPFPCPSRCWRLWWSTSTVTLPNDEVLEWFCLWYSCLADGPSKCGSGRGVEVHHQEKWWKYHQIGRCSRGVLAVSTVEFSLRHHLTHWKVSGVMWGHWRRPKNRVLPQQ